MTVDDLSQLTLEAVHSALVHEEEPDSPSTISTFTVGRTVTSDPHPQPKPSDSPILNKNKDLPNLSTISGFAIEPVRRTTSEPQPQPQSPIIAPPMAKSASMFTSLLRGRKKKLDSVDDAEGQASSESYIHDAPPPAPPKDKGKVFALQYPEEITSRQVLAPLRRPAFDTDNSYYLPQRSRTGSLSEYAVISHASSSHVHDQGQFDEFGQNQNQSVYLGHRNASQARDYDPPVHAMSMPAGLRGKWGSEPMDAAERLRRRQEELKRRQEEEEKAKWEEERMKEERRKRKEQELREIEEAEARRRASIEEEVRMLAAERQKKEMLEKEEEERKRREIEERRRFDRERRMEEHRRLEEWRKEQARMAEESARRTEEARRKEEVERKKKIQVAEAKVKKNHSVDALISGWVSMQTDDSLLWKRRFYKFIGTSVYFYRNPKVCSLFLFILTDQVMECVGHARILGQGRVARSRSGSARVE